MTAVSRNDRLTKSSVEHHPLTIIWSELIEDKSFSSIAIDNTSISYWYLSSDNDKISRSQNLIVKESVKNKIISICEKRRRKKVSLAFKQPFIAAVFMK